MSVLRKFCTNRWIWKKGVNGTNTRGAIFSTETKSLNATRIWSMLTDIGILPTYVYVLDRSVKVIHNEVLEKINVSISSFDQSVKRYLHNHYHKNNFCPIRFFKLSLKVVNGPRTYQHRPQTSGRIQSARAVNVEEALFILDLVVRKPK